MQEFLEILASMVFAVRRDYPDPLDRSARRVILASEACPVPSDRRVRRETKVIPVETVLLELRESVVLRETVVSLAPPLRSRVIRENRVCPVLSDCLALMVLLDFAVTLAWRDKREIVVLQAPWVCAVWMALLERREIVD